MKLKTKVIRAAAMGSLLAFSAGANAYNVVDRFKIIDDKLKTEQMLRPIGHDFFLDVSAALNTNVTDVMDDIDKATKTQGTAQQKIDEARRVLVKYDKTEQTLKVNVALGTPLPSFTAWDVNFKPNFRVFVDVGANLGIRSQKLTFADIYNYFPVEVPNDLKQLIAGLTPNTDIVNACKGNTSLSASTQYICSQLPLNQYFMPDLTQEVPVISIFGKGDGKAGFFTDYTKGEHFFGNFNLYGLGRADLYQVVDSKQIANGQKIEAPKKMNTEVTVQADYRIGYKNSNYTSFLSVEELKLSKVKERSDGSREQTYGYDPLLRLHADATFRLSALSLQPFAGVHKRSGYGFSDGMYLGAVGGAYVWGDRLGLQLRGMVDKQYFTLTPRIKLWLMQLEYSLKKPLKAMDGDVKLSALHSLDFRLFF